MLSDEIFMFWFSGSSFAKLIYSKRFLFLFVLFCERDCKSRGQIWRDRAMSEIGVYDVKFIKNSSFIDSMTQIDSPGA